MSERYTTMSRSVRRSTGGRNTAVPSRWLM